MTNSKKNYSEILNLKSSAIIEQEIADRQLDVIFKGYEYLQNPEHNVFYIADEVGLGKTYMALGIAFLFRHFSENNHPNHDAILVPKKNLQTKWKNEINNFTQNNYKGTKKCITSQLEKGVKIKERVRPIEKDDLISIFRMSSFSVIASRRKGKKITKTEVKEYFRGCEKCKDYEKVLLIIEKAQKIGWLNLEFHRRLRNLLAYLMNVCSPQLNCVIIDEAHNYKYGPGSIDDKQSIRNETTARFLGAFRDDDIFDDFPELEELVKFPLARKVICLSATPKDRNLIEIKNQLSCFCSKHILSPTENDTEIVASLKKFLIRGNLNYNINGSAISRNKCTHEHRQGNVEKVTDAVPISLEDDFGSVFWQLLQYQSIKHLNQKNNPSFEIGMMAGFETYTAGITKAQRKAEEEKREENEEEEEKEDENSSVAEYDHRKEGSDNKSRDINVIRGLIDSYLEEFDEPPPHPKQSKLVESIGKQLKGQEKSLIFARRVATVYELESKLLSFYEEKIVVDTQLQYVQSKNYLKSDAISSLIQVYHTERNTDKFDEMVERLLKKKEVKRCIEDRMKSLGIDDEVSKKEIWIGLAHSELENSAFREEVKKVIRRKTIRIGSDLLQATIDALKKVKDESLLQSKDFVNEEDQDKERNDYFFYKYFKEGKVGHKHRSKLYREFWFDLNPVKFNNHFKIFDTSDLKFSYSPKKKGDAKIPKRQAFLNSARKITDQWNKYNTSDSFTQFSIKEGRLAEDSFLTILLLDLCEEEMKNWIKVKEQDSPKEFLLSLEILTTILLNIFRHGSGLLLGYVADQSSLDFNEAMRKLLSDDSPFSHVLEEVKTIIIDFDLIMQNNFGQRDINGISNVLSNLRPVVGATGRYTVNKSILAAKFRMPGFPYVLITTDILREGEDLHTYCQNVYHYGIAWNPSDIQQRSGRIDRINSMSYRAINKKKENNFEDKVQVFYPYLKHSFEVNQIFKLFKNLNSFVKTFNDIAETQKYDTVVDVNEVIEEGEIPDQITDNLKSKYDIDSFGVS